MSEIYAVFPLLGKTYCTKALRSWKCVDSDSSWYHWKYYYGTGKKMLDDEGKPILSQTWPDNYVCNIKILSRKYDIVFTSTHSEVIHKMNSEKMYFNLVYPDRSRKDELLRLYDERPYNGFTKEWLSDNWDSLIDQCEGYPGIHIILPENSFVMDIIRDLEVGRIYKDTKTNEFVILNSICFNSDFNYKYDKDPDDKYTDYVVYQSLDKYCNISDSYNIIPKKTFIGKDKNNNYNFEETTAIIPDLWKRK